MIMKLYQLIHRLMYYQKKFFVKLIHGMKDEMKSIYNFSFILIYHFTYFLLSVTSNIDVQNKKVLLYDNLYSVLMIFLFLIFVAINNKLYSNK